MIKRVFTLLTAVLLVFPILLTAYSVNQNKENESANVETITIGIPPEDFQNLVTREQETPYSVLVAADASRYRSATINICGSSSKVIGLNTAPHRVPFELNFSNGNDAVPPFKNPTVKLVNSYTPFHLVAEYIAFDLFSSFGIPTPEHSFAFLQFNKTDFGLYLAVEDVNRYFITKSFKGNPGSLYKSCYSDYPETSDHPEDYMGSSVWFGDMFAKINKGSQRFQQLLDALDQGNGYEKYLDVDQVLRFFACTAAIGGSDSILSGKTNFFLYENGNKFVLLPWDLSEAFIDFTSGIGIDSFPDDTSPDQKNPLFQLIMSDPKNLAQYHEYIRQINDSFLDPDRIKPYVRTLVEQLEPYFLRDHTMFYNDEQTPERLLTGKMLIGGNLLLAFDEMHRQLNEQLDGKSDAFYVPEGWATLEVNDLESAFELLNENFFGDPDIVQKVCDSYDEWQVTSSVSEKSSISKKEIILIVVLFVAAFVIILFLRKLIRFLRSRRQKEQQAN